MEKFALSPPARSQCHATRSSRRFSRQVDFFRQQFLQAGRRPFSEILSAVGFTQALKTIRAPWNDRIFTPLMTLWVFLGQVLSADHSCRAAVARLIAHRVSEGLRLACAPKIGPPEM